MPSRQPVARGGRKSAAFRRTDGNSRPGVVTVILVALSLVLITFSSAEGGTGVFSTIRGGFQTVTYPIRLVGSFLSEPVEGVGNMFRNLTADGDTLTDLEEQNAELTARNAELEEAALAAERLQALLDLQSAYSLESVAAQVISGSTDSWTRTVTINKGSSSGLGVGMAVTDANGVLGEIIECGAATSTVRLLSDENSSISCTIQGSGATGMLEGSADGTVYLNLISTDQEVEVGDTIVTGGLGGVFPKGLPVATVTSVNKSPGALYYTIEVELISKPANANEVLVITSLSEGQLATSDDIAAADEQDASATGATSSSSSATAGDSSATADAAATSDDGTATTTNEPQADVPSDGDSE